jgi:gliding motility-associated-like protein
MADIPNVFSPNQDGVNDLFVFDPTGGQPDLRYARLYDRYGGQVFEQRQWPVTWDGNDTRGKPFAPGVYTLVIRYACGGGETIERGSITLLK